MMRLFKVSNQQSKDCGEPPSIDGDDHKFSSYFQNGDGEQWIAYWDDEKGLCFRGGDIGWDMERVSMMGLVLNTAEQAWVIACRQATKNLRNVRER